MNQCAKRNKNKISKGIRKLPLCLLDSLVSKQRLERGEASGRLLRDEELDNEKNYNTFLNYEIRIYVTSFEFQNHNMLSHLISIGCGLLGT